MAALGAPALTLVRTAILPVCTTTPSPYEHGRTRPGQSPSGTATRSRCTRRGASTLTVVTVFDPSEMVARFRQRASAVKERGMPPIEGAERQRFREQAQRDYTDFAMIGDAEAELIDGILTLRIDLRPPEARADGSAPGTPD